MDKLSTYIPFPLLFPVIFSLSKDNKSVINKEDLQSSESIIEYTESELKRAKSYLKRDWKPDHTINLAAWDYVSKNSMLQDKKTDLDIEENQVVNAIK